MMKKLLATLLTLALLLSALPTASAAEIVIVDPTPAKDATEGDNRCGDALTWTLSKKGTLTVSGTGPMWDFWSKAHSEAPGWYDELENIRSLVVEEGVTGIGDYAFSYASGLKKISLPESLTRVGENAFSYCDSLERVSLPDSVTRVDDWAFSWCGGLTELELGAGLREIGGFAFTSCAALTSVALPEGLTALGKSAFSNCSSLTSLTLPESLTAIGDCAFLGCEGLADAEGFVILRGVLYDYFGAEEAVTIPEDVTVIGHSAFADDDWITAVTIPAGVTEIGAYAFTWCSLEEVTIPEGVTVLGEGAFSDCGSLAAVSLPESLTEIDTFAFSGTDLTEIAVPAGITTLSDFVFAVCPQLASVTLPEGLLTIGRGVLTMCPALTRVEIPASVQTVGAAAFSDCASLTAIEVAPGNQNYKSVNGALLSKDGTLLHSVPGGVSGSYTIPATVQIVGERAFAGCTRLTGAAIPAGVKTIGDAVFYGCRSLTELRFFGAAPSFHEFSFTSVTAEALYPAKDKSWTKEVRQDYGGNITWTAVTPTAYGPDLSLEGLSTAGAALRWTVVDGAESYQLQRRVGEGAWKDLKTLNRTAWTDETVHMNESYAYRVRAKANGAWTDWSGELSLLFNPFSDVSGAKTLEYLAWAYENGVVTGASPTTFAPDARCTRIQFVMMLWKLHGSPEVEGDNPFADISGRKTTAAILWALDAGVINSAPFFDPNAAISRAQVVMILWKLAGSPAVEGENPFADVSGKKTTQAVLWAYQQGITKGTGETRFSPDSPCTRIQLVVFLFKYNGIYHVI